MPRLAQLRKEAKALGFINEMKSLEFALGPNGFWFYRRRSEYIDVFAFWMKSSMEWVKVPITCLKYDLIDHCDMSVFPKGFSKQLPIYTNSVISKEGIGSLAWKVASDADIKATFSTLAEVIKTKVDPWFKNIDTDEKLYESFSLSFQETEKGQRLKKLLVG